jgi:hypothetical protein
MGHPALRILPERRLPECFDIRIHFGLTPSQRSERQQQQSAARQPREGKVFQKTRRRRRDSRRRARYTAQGTYLISYLSSSNVVEYDKNFNEIWRYGIKSPWAALRLKNGNTLITDEADNLTREVNPKGETAWELKNTDLPEAYRFNQAPQTCTRLANGNTVFCSRGGAGKGPQLVEVTPDKKVVWVLQDWKDLGDATAVQILDDPGIPENPGESQH